MGQQPHGVTVDSINRRVYVANHRSNNVLVLDADTLEVLDSVSLNDASGLNGIAVKPDTKMVYVAGKFSNSLSAVNVDESGDKEGVWEAPTGNQPDGVTLHSQLDLAYVANFGANTLTAVRLTDGETLEVPAGGQPSFLYFDPVSERLFVSNHLDGSLSIMDWEGRELERIQLSPGSYGLDFDDTRRLLYVANIDAKSVSVIAVDENGAPTHLGDVLLNCSPKNVAANDHNGRIFVVCPDEERVHIYHGDDLSYRYVGWLPVGKASGEGIAFDPVTSRFFITNAGDDTLTVIADGGPKLPPTPTPMPTPAPTAPPTCPAVVDEYEPDDGPEAARQLALPADQVSGTFHIPGDADWFVFDAPAGQGRRNIFFTGTAPDPDLLVRMEIFDASGAHLLATGFRQVSTTLPEEGGRFYLRVSNSSAYADCQSRYVLDGRIFLIDTMVHLPLVSSTQGGALQGASPGESPRTATSTSFGGATGETTALAVDGTGFLYSAGAGFVRKQSPDGQLLWQQEVGDRVQAVSVGANSVYVSEWGPDPRGNWIPLQTDPALTIADLNRPTGAVTILDPASGGVRGRITDLVRPSGLAVNPAGLWIAETGADRLLLASPDGHILRRLDLAGAPYVLEPTGEGVFVTTPGTNQVAFVGNGGDVRWQASVDGLGIPQDIVYDQKGRRLFVLHLLAPRYGQITVLDAATGDRVGVIEPRLDRPLSGANALTLDGLGELLVSTDQGVERFRLADLAPLGRVAAARLATPFGFTATTDEAGRVALWHIDRSRLSAAPLVARLE